MFQISRGESLEARLITELQNNRTIDLETALLVFSGLETAEQIAAYKAKITTIHHNFRRWKKSLRNIPRRVGHVLEGLLSGTAIPPFSRAKYLFEYLWETKPNRYHSKCYRFTDVIEGQLSAEE
ncbi:MAG: hypothetical protein Q8R53_00870, partial [Nanoarchaeota archaeon]|nr:hypothetical protein [Nanoarchaeota archaeon]